MSMDPIMAQVMANQVRMSDPLYNMQLQMLQASTTGTVTQGIATTKTLIEDLGKSIRELKATGATDDDAEVVALKKLLQAAEKVAAKTAELAGK